MNWILWIHPALQALATLISIHVLFYGARRFYCVVCRKTMPFPWKQHVFWGRITVIAWFAGLLIGLGAAKYFWKTLGATGTHYHVALAMIPLLAIAYATGEIMDRKKKKRKIMPLVHAVNNFILFALAVYQAASGIKLLEWLPR